MVSLSFPEGPLLASRYVKLAIPLMVKHNISPNPCNFALWYAYVSRRSIELVRELDNIIAKDGTCPDDKSIELFRRFIIGEEFKKSETVEKSLKNVLTNLQADVEVVFESTHEYQKNLNTELSQISTEAEPEKFLEVINHLIDSTEVVSRLAVEFKQQLKAAEDEIGALKKILEEKEEYALIDQLTQIGNRRNFDVCLYQAFQEESNKFSLILLDLDHFKHLNDNYGHVMGDKVLQLVGKLLKEKVPEDCSVNRYGGEEFAIIVPYSLEEAQDLAEKIRKEIGRLVIKKKNVDQGIANISASFGIAFNLGKEFPEELVERADSALYQAKKQGRNQVVINSKLIGS